MKRVIDFAVYLLVRLIVCVLQALPLRSCASLSRGMAWLCADVFHVRRSVLEENLASAFPASTERERRQLVRRMWEHLFLMIVEIAQAPRKIHETNWREYITLTGSERLLSTLLADRPAVIVTAHYGNFELSGYLLGLLGFSSVTVARPLDNVYLDRFLHDFRAVSGQFIISKHGSAQRIDQLVAEGGTLTLLGDQHAGPKGCWVDFFGRPASTHKAIALFAMVNRAPIALCYCRRVGKPLHHIVGAEAVIDVEKLDPSLQTVPALTQWYTRVLENIIRREPGQYWWLHRRWKDTRPKRPSQQQAA